MSEVIHVAVAAIVNQNNEVLISLRAEDSHQGGLWEFPGGKLEKNETVEQALIREAREELGIQLVSFRPLIKIRHQYEDKKVFLDVWKVDEFRGEPAGLEGQPVRWQSVKYLDQLKFPEADLPIIRALNLPEQYLITGKFETQQEFESRLTRAMENGIKLVQLRLTDEWLGDGHSSSVTKIIDTAVILSEKFNVTLMLNLPNEIESVAGNSLSRLRGLHGIHLNSRKLKSINKRPCCDLLSASCHNFSELKKAQELKVDFAVLSPVKATASHPETPPLGWDGFSELVDQVSVPVYALGGMDRDDTHRALLAGGQGIAGIGSLWNSEE